MVKLADALDLGSSGEIRAGSSPAGGTKMRIKTNDKQKVKSIRG